MNIGVVVEPWEMTDEEANLLGALPEVVKIWPLRVDEDEFVFLLSEERAQGRARAEALAGGWAMTVKQCVVARDRIVAVDLARGSAQVV